ncbi:MAG: hypothetical protein LBK60_06290 [Verrucomicrobiales bacterium]|jgi:hypothetical protein|nr:hypothetical protein [Verrucomicrobiales bacterium]
MNFELPCYCEKYFIAKHPWLSVEATASFNWQINGEANHSEHYSNSSETRVVTDNSSTDQTFSGNASAVSREPVLTRRVTLPEALQRMLVGLDNAAQRNFYRELPLENQVTWPVIIECLPTALMTREISFCDARAFAEPNGAEAVVHEFLVGTKNEGRPVAETDFKVLVGQHLIAQYVIEPWGNFLYANEHPDTSSMTGSFDGANVRTVAGQWQRDTTGTCRNGNTSSAHSTGSNNDSVNVAVGYLRLGFFATIKKLLVLTADPNDLSLRAFMLKKFSINNSGVSFGALGQGTHQYQESSSSVDCDGKPNSGGDSGSASFADNEFEDASELGFDLELETVNKPEPANPNDYEIRWTTPAVKKIFTSQSSIESVPVPAWLSANIALQPNQTRCRPTRRWAIEQLKGTESFTAEVNLTQTINYERKRQTTTSSVFEQNTKVRTINTNVHVTVNIPKDWPLQVN